uniref:hypothetical protein n=1 Tax=Acetatifactor sp. TaxID=1872090 RepID=UPI0040567814
MIGKNITTGNKVDEECNRIKIAEFYGFEIYCDLKFLDGPFYYVEYHGGDEPYCGRIDIELGEISGNFDKYVKSVLEAWYDDNKDILLEIWETKSLLEIPEWEED